VTHRLGDGLRVILWQSVRGSVRAVRALRNTRVFLTETRVVADVMVSRTICLGICLFWSAWNNLDPKFAVPLSNNSMGTDWLEAYPDDKIAELIAIFLQKFNPTDYKSWRMDIGILFNCMHVHGIVDGTVEAQDTMENTEYSRCKMQHLIVWSTTLHRMQRSWKQW